MSVELAVSIVKKLFNAGFIAYFAGGWVRDYLLGHPTDEIDIATNATPEHICRLFPKTVLVGAQFGVVVVVLKGHNFEVTTFRKDHAYIDGRHPEGVDFSSPEKDAERRDFTINGLFYDPLTDKIYDFVEGKADLQKKIIRAIGDPAKRFQEDKLRLIRAIRFAFRLGFSIDPKTEEALAQFAPTLFPSVSIERVWQEFVKMSKGPRFAEALIAMHHFHLLPTIFPKLKDISLEEIKRRVSFFPYYPLHTPTIVYLWDLFPNIDLNERIDLCHYLKITRQDVKLGHFFARAHNLFHQKTISRAEWADFYADPHSELFLEIEGVKIQDKAKFFAFHQKQKENLAFHIDWIQRKEPLVRAAHLLKEGIQAGVKMGLLLHEAHKIAINEDLRETQAIVEKLKQTSLW